MVTRGKLFVSVGHHSLKKIVWSASFNCSNIKKQETGRCTYHSKEKIITRPLNNDVNYIKELNETDKKILKENSEKLINILKNVINKIDN